MTVISIRDLDFARPYKPLDFGNGRAAGSVALDARILTLSTYHPYFGYVTLSAHPPFPDEKRFDQAAVRAYRAGLADPSASAFGLVPGEPWTQSSVGLLEDAVPRIRLANASLQAQVTTWALQGPDKPPAAAVQEWQLENISGKSLDWSFTWRGLIHLTRASMTQLTEGGVIPFPSAHITVDFSEGVLVIHNPALDSAVAILGLPLTPPFNQAGTAVEVAIPGHLNFQPAESKTLTFTLAFGRTPAQARQRAEHRTKLDLHAGLDAICQAAKARSGQIDSFVPSQVQLLGHRALSYVLGCCALRVNESNCLLTDHQILPLSWTRDAYYIAVALMSQPGKRNLDIVRRHLLWLFERARRPDGHWGRAYLPNGFPKDDAFQLDQQCYPLLELADYERTSHDHVTL
ncbi:MAG TPA: hypothetical protein VE136_14985, partial [Anaerolineales bacterium]|nr:hypothetical protein [Anaerolineales bacterium]